MLLWKFMVIYLDILIKTWCSVLQVGIIQYLWLSFLSSSGSLSIPVGFLCIFHSSCFCGTLLVILESSLSSLEVGLPIQLEGFLCMQVLMVHHASCLDVLLLNCWKKVSFNMWWINIQIVTNSHKCSSQNVLLDLELCTL